MARPVFTGTRLRLSKNFVFVDVGAGAHTGPTVESPDFADISYKSATFVKGPMRASAPTNGFFDTLNTPNAEALGVLF